MDSDEIGEAPESYLDERRIPILQACQREGLHTPKSTEDMIAILTKKGYFTPNPRPWAVAFRDRGHGHGDYGVVDKFGDLIAGGLSDANAKLIAAAVNSYTE